jgi:hypothetical protein
MDGSRFKSPMQEKRSEEEIKMNMRKGDCLWTKKIAGFAIRKEKNNAPQVCLTGR